MYGYVIPDKLNMFMKDYYRYRAFYCGLCKCIGREQGEAMRFTTNYDMTFFSLFVHGVTGIEPEFRREGCVLSPFKKKSIARRTPLMTSVARVNAMLMYYKLKDDEYDGGKRALNAVFVKKHYLRAKKHFPELDKIYSDSYSRLRQLEQAGSSSIDMLSDPFADMMRETARAVLQDAYTEEIGALMYNVGKFVYITDAIDDADDDHKSGSFNLFLIDYEYRDRKAFNQERGEELREIAEGVYSRIKECFSKVELKTNEGVVANILWYGVLERLNAVLAAENKLKLPRV